MKVTDIMYYVILKGCNSWTPLSLIKIKNKISYRRLLNVMNSKKHTTTATLNNYCDISVFKVKYE